MFRTTQQRIDMTRKQTIADVAVELMNERKETTIGMASYGLTQDVWEECYKRGIVKKIGVRGGRDRSHPVNKIVRVCSALYKDERFEKMPIRCCGYSPNEGERLVRQFRLLEK